MLVIQIIILIAGVVCFIKGELNITSKSKISGASVKGLGGFYVVVALLMFFQDSLAMALGYGSGVGLIAEAVEIAVIIVVSVLVASLSKKYPVEQQDNSSGEIESS